jgi:hypothetical protein
MNYEIVVGYLRAFFVAKKVRLSVGLGLADWLLHMLQVRYALCLVPGWL